MNLVFWLLALFLALFLVKQHRYRLLEYVPHNHIPGVPVLRKSVAMPLFLNLPRDQAFEQMTASIPDLKDFGMFQMQLYRKNLLFVTDTELLKEMLSRSGTEQRIFLISLVL